MSQSITLSAPGKINPTLEIVGKNAQGWFELELSWQKIALADEVTVELCQRRSGIELSCSHPKVPQGLNAAANNCTRGVELLTEYLREQDPQFSMPGLKIHIDKQLPLCGGLGGSSTDVAATVQALTQLLDLRIPSHALNKIMAQVGHDCPFFAQAAPHCRGREKTADGVAMQRLLPISCHLVLVCSPIEMTAAAAYQNFPWSAASLTRPTRTQRLAQALQDGAELDALAALFCNDLEASSGGINAHPTLGPILSDMRKLGCLSAHLSGSGSSLFGIAASQEEGEAIVAELSRRHGDKVDVLLTQTLSEVAEILIH